MHCRLCNFGVLLFCLVAAASQFAGPRSAAAEEPVYDLVIYGGTSGGVAAGVQARRMGKTAVIVEPGQHLGGLTTGGLGATDIGNKGAIGGISREFYQRIKTHYADPAAWKHEKPEKPEKSEIKEIKTEKIEIKEVKNEKIETDGVFDPGSRFPPGPDPRFEQVIQAVAGLTRQVTALANQVEELQKRVGR